MRSKQNKERREKIAEKIVRQFASSGRRYDISFRAEIVRALAREYKLGSQRTRERVAYDSYHDESRRQYSEISR